MMKRLAVLTVVLAVTSFAGAGVIDVVVDPAVNGGVGSQGHAGTAQDPLVLGETIGIKVLLNFNDNPGSVYPSYEGYALSSIDLDLHISGPGLLLGPPVATDGMVKAAYRNTGLSPWTNTAFTSTGTDKFSGVALTPIFGAANIMWGMQIQSDGFGPVLVDLTLNGQSDYKIFGNDSAWRLMVEGDLGDLTIHQVPEPMTLALLGVGGLLLRRRGK